MEVKNRQQVLAIAAGAVFALFAADRWVVTRLWHAWTGRVAQVAQLRKKVADGRSLLNREQSLRGRWADMQANTLPNNPALAEQKVVQAFDHSAQSSQVNILSTSLQWKHDNDDYMTLECNLEAGGSLSALTRFLYNIEKEPMALKLQTVELSSKDSEGRQLNLGLQVNGLVLTPPEPRSPAGGKL